jgi:transposase
VCQLRASRRYGRYVRLTQGGLLRIDAAKRQAEEQLDGKFVVHSNDDSLTPADLALGYKQLQRVEEAWRTLKSGLRIRPVYHWAVHRIHAHVSLSVLALLLERIIEQTCGDTWRNIQADLDQIKLAQLFSPHGEVWQVTAPSPEAANHLKCLEIKNPPAVVHLA